ncbi:hypothetical protein [Streptomyces sp. NBC_01304]|uniref:hypothetical protein n=1 Tax=Streptomyces sp. NBC_01304 TaxID=2903818 RepID=UPI002E0D2470|nr:hypothetical protein OG430_46095 [Streptomyces sp. NBC_01304]
MALQQLPVDVEIGAQDQRLFVGSCARIGLTIAEGSPLTFEDLERVRYLPA